MREHVLNLMLAFGKYCMKTVRFAIKWGLTLAVVIVISPLVIYLSWGIFIPVSPAIDEQIEAGYMEEPSGNEMFELIFNSKEVLEIHNSYDVICNWCIHLMYQMADIFGTTYGFVNVMLFIILEPLAIVLFWFSATLFYSKKRGVVRNKVGKFTYIAGILSVIAVILPIIYTIIVV